MKTYIKLGIALLFSLLLGVNSVSAKDKPAKKDTVYMECYMDCNKCVSDIEKQLTFTKGVKGLKVDLASQTIMVVYSPKKTNSDKLVASVKEIEKDPAIISEEEYKKKKKK